MNTTSKKQITDLAELRSAIRKTRDICIIVRARDSDFLCFARVSKKEAVRLTIESDKFDDYAAELEDSYLFLNGELRSGLRAERLPMRNAARLAELLERKASYERCSLALPDYLVKELARLQPAALAPTPSLVFERGTATVPASVAA